MKYLKTFNESLNRSEIDVICKKYKIENYNINEDGSIDVNGDVVLSYKGLIVLPLNFRNVSGNFDCSSNSLTTLKGSPIYVGETYICSENNLISLESAPQKVDGDFYCSDNHLTTLKYISKYIKGDLICLGNEIKNIDYLPKKYINLYIDKNPIIHILSLFVEIDFDNYYYELENLFDDSEINFIKGSKGNKELISEFNDREIIQNDILIMDRLVEFLEDIGKPKSKEELYELLKNEYEIR